MTSKKRHVNIPVFIPELACPYQCRFCNQKKITSTSAIVKVDEIKAIVECSLATTSSGCIIDIAFFGGSFTGIEPALQERYLREANTYVMNGRVSGIRVSTRPDYISIPVLERLKKYGVHTIELGAQSTNNEVLNASGRGHDAEAIWKAAWLIKEYGFHLGLQMMIGLPEDTHERSVQTARDIITMGATSTRIYPTLVIKGTALETLFIEGQYFPLSMERAIDLTAQLLLLFEDNQIDVLRVGLHPSEEISLDKSLVAGPFHPSFKELVMTEIWYKLIKDNIKSYTLGKISIDINDKQINYAIGYESSNRKRLKTDGWDIAFAQYPHLSKYEIRVSNS